MHKSRLAGFIIDCRTDDLDGAAAFWGNALGWPASRFENPAEADYRLLETGRDGLHVEVQKVDHESRVHLDIETDNIEAEVARLETLGAKPIAQVKTWWVMEAPSGQRFCVVSPIEGKDGGAFNQWD
ncbi:MAG: VOC family protein [Hyphomicrobiales bacterium]